MRAADAALPLVSIVLPTYTRAQLLHHAIRSVLRQTYPYFELIVIDDNSQDDTPEVVRAFGDPRIRYYRNEENLKLPRGLNKGFGLARGAYLTWTSDDNLYAPEAIAKMVAVLRGGGCDFVFADYFDFWRLDGRTGEPLEPRRVRLPDVLRMEEGNNVGACFMYTRAVYDAIGAYDPELYLVEDYDYFIRMHQRFQARHIPEALYYFGRHDDSLTTSRFAEIKAADLLVRYKNRLLDAERATEACAKLVTRDLGALTNPLLSRPYPVIKRTSFRLTVAYERAVRAYVERRLRAPVSKLLEDFAAQAVSFREAKDALRDVMLGMARLESQVAAPRP
jgi:glycosyltransferase involved in cell wall biosynthesis